jgi:hypothetical protein
MITRRDFFQEKPTIQDRIFNFLQKNRKNAYTEKEIRKYLKLKKAVNTYLIRLKVKNKILHKKPYWIAK